MANRSRSFGKMIRRYAIRIILCVLGLILIVMSIIYTYVLLNKPSILRKVTAELNSRMNAKIKITDIDMSFFHNFPDISVLLSKVSIRDSLWQQHPHDLLTAEKIFVEFNPFSLFSGSPTISKIIVEEGTLYLFYDSTGYSNANIFRSGPVSSRKNRLASLPGIGIRNVHLVIDEGYRKKIFEFYIQRLDCDSKAEESFWQLNLNLAVQVGTLSFNTDMGGYLQEKPVAGKIKLQFNPTSKVFQFENIALQIDHVQFTITGKFFLGEVPPPFHLIISTQKILYRQATALIANNIREKLDKYNILKPISVTCSLDGTSTEFRDPLIEIIMKMDNSTVITPVGNFSGAAGSVSFTNQWMPGRPRGDDNSRLHFSSFSGFWEKFLLRSNEVSFTNLKHPLLRLDLHSDFDLPILNDVIGSKSMRFDKGTGKLNIVFQGPLLKSDSMETQINGTFKIREASIDYLPRDFQLKGGNGTVRFKGQDIFIDELRANAGTSRLTMYGSAKNLLTLIGNNPEKLVLDWNISSPFLHLQDFISFLGKRSDSSSKKKEKALLMKTGLQIDRMLKDCAFRLQVKANQLEYKKFFATNISAALLLDYDQVLLQNVVLEHAGGSLGLKGSIQNDGNTNKIVLQSEMNKVDLAKVFTAFDNFGQTAILDKNLDGKLDATIKLKGLISNRAELVSNSLTGTIEWSIKEGRLIQYAPLEKISRLAFKNRSFSDIYFAELKDRFEILGTEIKFNRMEIQSTALAMFVEGSYDVKKGADMSIQIPLSNLKSKKAELIPANKGITSKTGISLRLRAKSGPDGKLNVSWDPFKMALKKE